MKNIRHEAAIWAQLLTIVGIWVALLYLTGTPMRIDMAAVKHLPDVVLIYGFVYLVFTRWAWRWPLFRGWLVPLPNLQGTWIGTLDSTHQDRTTPIPVTIVIRQTFDAIHCSMYTEESDSTSVAAMLARDEVGISTTLNYTYANTPRAAVRNRSAMHNGATALRVITVTDERRLEGQYWTDRQTTGDIAVTFSSKQLAETMQLAPSQSG
jgi:hypothetical protein